MVYEVNMQNVQSNAQTKEKQPVFQSPFDCSHSIFMKVKNKDESEKFLQVKIGRDGVFQLTDISKLDEFTSIPIEKLTPLKKYEKQPWTKELFNKTSTFLLDNIKKFSIDNAKNSYFNDVTLLGLIDKLCFKSKDLTPENRAKILEISMEYGIELPKSFRNSLDEFQKSLFDYNAKSFGTNGEKIHADEVKEITDEGEIIYMNE